MSVASKNPFALLNDDDEPVSAAPAQASAAAAPSPAAAPSARGGAQRGRGGPASRGGKYYARGGSKSGPAADSAEDAVDGAAKRVDGERGRGRGRGRARGEGRGRGGGGRGRDFDRHSSTGKTDSQKKIHQGWGGDEGSSELKAEEGGQTDAVAEGTATAANDWDTPAPAADAWGTPAPAADAWGTDAPAAEASNKTEGAPNEARRRPREEEEEDNTLTLEQYLAQKKEKEDLLIPKLEGVRIANEGVDDSLWKNAKALSKKDEEDDAYFVGKGKSAPKQKAQKVEKVFLEIDARFERPARGGRGGRGVGGGRGRGDFGGSPSPRGNAPRGGRGGRRGASNGAVDVDDQTAFPSLS